MPGWLVEGEDDRVVGEVNTRLECEELCLLESEFTCASAEFYYREQVSGGSFEILFGSSFPFIKLPVHHSGDVLLKDGLGIGAKIVIITKYYLGKVGPE